MSGLCYTVYDKGLQEIPLLSSGAPSYEPSSHQLWGTRQDSGATRAKGQDSPMLQLPLLLVSPPRCFCLIKALAV